MKRKQEGTYEETMEQHNDAKTKTLTNLHFVCNVTVHHKETHSVFFPTVLSP